MAHRLPPADAQRLPLPDALDGWLTDALPGLPADLWPRLLRPARSTLRAPDVLAHSELVAPVCSWAELPPEATATLLDLVDLLQVVIDLTDDLGDWAEDQARGREPAARYDHLPLPVLAAIPPLLTGLVVQRLGFTFGPRGVEAAGRLLVALAEMAGGQGRETDLHAKVDAVAGRQAELLLLPLWLADPSSEAARHLPSLQRWCRSFGRTWEWREQVQDHPEDDHAANALRRAVAGALATWPSVGPFASGGPLSPWSLGLMSLTMGTR